MTAAWRLAERGCCLLHFVLALRTHAPAAAVPPPCRPAAGSSRSLCRCMRATRTRCTQSGSSSRQQHLWRAGCAGWAACSRQQRWPSCRRRSCWRDALQAAARAQQSGRWQLFNLQAMPTRQWSLCAGCCRQVTCSMALWWQLARQQPWGAALRRYWPRCFCRSVGRRGPCASGQNRRSLCTYVTHAAKMRTAKIGQGVFGAGAGLNAVRRSAKRRCMEPAGGGRCIS